ncbi:MAG: nitroreductase [Cocleimonas sp.]|jgi:nitroreductase
MNVIEALKQRKSVRAFLDKAVSDETIHTLLEAARYSPSGTNTQPWQVAVVKGKSKIALQEKIESAFRNGDSGKADFDYYPKEWISPFKDRRKECGLLMYSNLEIKREDKEQQMDQWAANYRAFDAPVMMLFFMDPIMEKGSFMDYGMFLQSIMLAAEGLGLATCPQASLADYPHIIKPTLGFGEDSILLCGIALGYEDKNAVVNSYRTSRLAVNEFTQFFE